MGKFQILNTKKTKIRSQKKKLFLLDSSKLENFQLELFYI